MREIVKNLFKCILVVTVFSGSISFSDENIIPSKEGYMEKFIKDVQKTVIFIGIHNSQRVTNIFATGFYIEYQGVFYLVTAKHVVKNALTLETAEHGLCILLNAKDDNIIWRSIDDLKKKNDVNWIFHRDNNVDIAIIPVGIVSEIDDIKYIPESLFLSEDKLFELYEIFFLSYQPGTVEIDRISPIFRGGIISRINKDRTLYIDGAAFPGNSGSPVFLRPSPIRFDRNNISIGRDPLGGKFIGIIGSYIPYQDVAISSQTRRPRVVFEENTGISIVWPVEYIKEILDSDVSIQQRNKLNEQI